jgi:hypothetical protein
MKSVGKKFVASGENQTGQPWEALAGSAPRLNLLPL